MAGNRQRTIVTILLHLCVAVAAALLLVVPMSIDDWGSFLRPPWQQFLVGVICGAIASPVVCVAFHRKRKWCALPILVVPPMAATVAAWIASRFDLDYAYFDLGIPLLYVGALLVFFCAPGIPPEVDPNACIHCGYDRRANPVGRCPECGKTDRDRLPRSMRTRPLAWHAAAMVLALAVSIPAQFVFCRWLLSLG